MAVLFLTTFIAAPVERVFDLSMSIDLHILSTQKTKEKAIAGVTKGLIGPGQTVTWQAFHLLKKRTFTSKITGYQRPAYFRDEMIKGDFRKFTHDHGFKSSDEQTEMYDKVIFELPFGIAGKAFNNLFLINYIKQLLQQRNKVIKYYAETDLWQKILSGSNG